MIPELVVIALSSFVIGLSGAMSPGPLLTITIAETLKRGNPWIGPLIILGHAVLELALVIAIIAGLGSILLLRGVKTTLFIVGGFLLFALSVLTFRAGNSPPDTKPQTAKPSGNFLTLPIIGIVGSLSNPYWTIWWATIGLGYMAVAIKFGWPGVMAFFIGHILSDFAWYTIVSVALSKGRKIISAKWYKRALQACAAVLFVFALIFLYVGINTLFSYGTT
jgi:threonine/homoserine/homoserine lactone efflux protein